MYANVFALSPISGRLPPPPPPQHDRRAAAGFWTTRKISDFGGGRVIRVDERSSGGGGRRRPCGLSRASSSMASPAAYDWFLRDGVAALLTSVVAMSLLRFWEELARRRIFEQTLSRKLVHISVGLVFMLFWPLFSSGNQAPFFAALAPGLNIFRMLLLGLGIMKNDDIVKSMSRTGDYRELLKGPFYYACTLTLATAYFWRNSPISVAAICNLCAGDGVADIVGRRFGHQKLPYNRDKSFMGSIAMALAGFIASVGYMHYFSSFGYIQESWQLGLGFLLVSIVSAIVESLPVSTKLDDNLTVTLASVLAGILIL